MFKYVSFIFILLTPYLALSQTNESEAKAAFLLAEEFYAKSDFKNALGFIEKAKKSLGEGNCKIFYLEILMRNEMYKLDKSQYEPLIGSINSFQSSKDIDAFNREKVFEVLKIKMLVEQEQDNKRIADSLALSEKIRNEKKFDAKLVAQGYSTPKIASALFISELTVSTHRKNIIRKLNLENSVQLGKYIDLFN